MAHWADSARLCYEVYECAICEPFPSDVLCDTMWLILEFLDVFKKKGCLESLLS